MVLAGSTPLEDRDRADPGPIAVDEFPLVIKALLESTDRRECHSSTPGEPAVRCRKRSLVAWANTSALPVGHARHARRSLLSTPPRQSVAAQTKAADIAR